MLKDEKEAVAWYHMAAAQGHVKAQTYLGISYDQGQGVPKDEKEAVAWYRKAAEQGNAVAQLRLGLSYALGTGIAKDDVMAYMWFNLAAAQGSDSAKSSRIHLEKEMSRSEIEKAQALCREWIASHEK